MRPGTSNANEILTILSANANSLKNKIDSLRFNVSLLKPDIIVIQETKFKREYQGLLEGYRCFNTIRGDSGRGVLIAVRSTLKPARIYEGDSECEVLTVEIALEHIKIRIVAGYGPQECAPLIVREKYRNTVEEEIEKAKLTGCMVLVAEDANAKLGSTVIPLDQHPMSDNGKLLDSMIKRQELLIINKSEKCYGGPIRIVE